MTPSTTTFNIDGVTYVRWNDHAEGSGMDPDTYQVHIRFSKQKNKYVIAKGPTKTTIKAVKATDVGEHTHVVTDNNADQTRRWYRSNATFNPFYPGYRFP